VVLRDERTIGDAAFQRVEEELDWSELGWAQLDRTGREGVTLRPLASYEGLFED
jgi:hypothetical protein